MLKLKNITILGSMEELKTLPQTKLLINTINAHSYNTAQKDDVFAEALEKGDVLIPDGASIVKACRWIKAKSRPKERIAGWDLFSYEMQALEERSMKIIECNHSTENATLCKVMFMGSSEKVLEMIHKRAAVDYPHLQIVTYSPPYKPEFTAEDNNAIINAINTAQPDLLWIGMTAPKQEKWAYSHWGELNINCHCGTIGAVFDFYAGSVKRAPLFWQKHSMEWLYRLLKEPIRMRRRYIIGNPLFIWNVLKEKFKRV